MQTQVLPVIFFGHGSPMNAIEDNQYSKKWKELGKTLPKPKAILAISAHWQANGVRLTGNSRQQTIHDFGGFPKLLYQQQYAPLGEPNLCKRIQQLIPEAIIDNNWGLDHGTWSVLIHVYPKQDIPVIQLSLNNSFSEQEHYNLAKKLSQLRREGVLIIGSGNIIHSFREIDWAPNAKPKSWCVDFVDLVKNAIKNNEHTKLINYKQLELGLRASPTPDHYLPFLYILGLKEETDKVTVFNDQIDLGSMAMTSFIFGQ